MKRGKQQIMFYYLPGKTFDFDKNNILAIVDSIDGEKNTDINLDFVLKSIQGYTSGWSKEYIPMLTMENLSKKENFVLIDPKKVKVNMYPLVLWCQNPSCGRIYPNNNESMQDHMCPICKKEKLIQLRWIKVHRCGQIKPLIPYCSNCKSSYNISLNTRESQRVGDFKWKCNTCGKAWRLFGGKCSCNWPGLQKDKNMEIKLIRAGDTFYSHHIVQMNIIKGKYNRIFSIKEWPQLAALFYLKAPEMNNKNWDNFLNKNDTNNENRINYEEIREKGRNKGYSKENIDNSIEMLRDLLENGDMQNDVSSTKSLAQNLVKKTGISSEIWEKIGQEMLEAIIPESSEHPTKTKNEVSYISTLGLTDIKLINDFPILHATFGYSRLDLRPDLCNINPFPRDKDHGNKFPIYTDIIGADAIFLKLDQERIIAWLKANEFEVDLPSGTCKSMSSKAYYVKLFDDMLFNVNISNDKPQARMVFGLMHTLGHMAVKKASLLCGLESTSLSEYIIPRSLTIGIYSSHRSGNTIGALKSLFDQTLEEWLEEIIQNKQCVYDPVCTDDGATCHFCTHLAETSCRFFNLNLSRSFLFGGIDKELGPIKYGYFDDFVGKML